MTTEGNVIGQPQKIGTTAEKNSGELQKTGTTSDYLFDRLESIRFFTREDDMEYTGCGNTDSRGLKARVLH